VWGCARRPERPVDMCDDAKKYCEGVNGTCAAKRCEHVFGKIVDVVCLAVVGVQENLHMFPGCFYGVGIGASPSRTKFEYRADCKRDIACTLTQVFSRVPMYLIYRTET
jgi:hypothetical protein